MNGLEAVEVKFSYTENLVDFRIDAETYKKDFLNNEKIIATKAKQSIESLSISVQNFGAYSLCNYIVFIEKGVPFLQTQNISENLIDFSNDLYITKDVHELLYKSHCKKGQVLLTMAGAYLGKAAVFNEDFECSSNQAIAKITLKSGIDPFYVSTFLNSKFGQLQVNRLRTVTGQPNINMGLIKLINIPSVSELFQQRLSKVVLSGTNVYKESNKIYHQAETLLLNELGLHTWQPTEANTEVKSFKNSFLQSGRLDAEYYQPKYDEVVTKIKSVDYDCLHNLVSIKKSIEPGSDAYMEEGIPFIRVSNLSKFGITEPDIFLYKQQFDNLESLYLKKDTVLLTKDGSVGIAYKVEEDKDAVTSGAILHLTIKDKRVIADYLTLVLNSKLIQMQAERDAGGSIIQHWRSNEIEQVLIPIIEIDKQNEMAQLVQQSFTLKKQSQHLLNIAKRAVEIAIEESEERAMVFINEQTKNG